MEEELIEATLDEIRNALKTGRIGDAIAALTRLHPADRADAFSELDGAAQSTILPQLDIPATADLLEELEDEEAADVAENLSTERLADVLDEMEPDEAADVLGDLPPETAARALAEMDDAEEVIPLLEHPDETAGGLMTTWLVTLQPEETASHAIEKLRTTELEEEGPYYLYVVDESEKLVGVVGLRDLVIATPSTRVVDFMDPEVKYATAGIDQEDVARLMARYDLSALPVVNDAGKLLGVITVDDVVDVLEEEATEDIYRLARLSDADLNIDSPVSLSVRRRLPWLLLSTLTALFASWVISNFEGIFEQVAVLAVFQSVVAGLGGNAGTQSLAIAVRAIALGEVALKDIWRTIAREIATGIIQGVSVGLFAGLGVYLWRGNPWLGLILGLALIGNMLVAVIVGTTIPLGLKALGQDPALASAVLVTTVTDSVGFAIFLGLATLLLPLLTVR
jgi:magnesium transporter